MIKNILLGLGLSGAIALSAAAQQPATPPSKPSTTPGQSQADGVGQNTSGIQQHMTQDLEKAGFTGVQIMPESFLVRAKDKDGRPVMMVINPDSVTSVTAISAPASSGNQTTPGAAPTGSTTKQ